jgi:sarcosine oxidase subunit gamma
MVDTYLRQSPLAHVHLNAHPQDENPDIGITVTEIPYRQQYVLRGSSADKDFANAVETILLVPLPTEPCRTSGDADHLHILWMGPDEWLIVAPDGDLDALIQKLTEAFEGQHTSIVDVSHSRTTLRLSGIHARETLTKGCSIDLHPRAFSKSHVVNTLLAQAHVTLHQVEDGDDAGNCAYDIYVHRSFAEYLWVWLQDASREYK